MKKKLKARLPVSTPPWYKRGPDRRTRMAFKKHGRALADALSDRLSRKALGSGRPWKYQLGRDVHTGLKRFMLRCISTLREAAR